LPCPLNRCGVVLISSPINVLPTSENMASVITDGIANANALRAQFEIHSLESSLLDKTAEHGESVIIVGAGAFGSSLALELATHYRDKYTTPDHKS